MKIRWYMFSLILLCAAALVAAAGQGGSGNGGANADAGGTGNADAGTDTSGSDETGAGTDEGKPEVGNVANAGDEAQLREEERQQTMEQAREQIREQVRNTLQVREESGVQKAQLSSGRDAEIKIMPETASETAIARLQLKSCDGCTIELKEVGSGDQARAAYEVQTQKESRVLGIFRARMQVRAQIDAENGEVIRAQKPWWAFLAAE